MATDKELDMTRVTLYASKHNLAGYRGDDGTPMYGPVCTTCTGHGCQSCEWRGMDLRLAKSASQIAAEIKANQPDHVSMLAERLGWSEEKTARQRQLRREMDLD